MVSFLERLISLYTTKTFVCHFVQNSFQGIYMLNVGARGIVLCSKEAEIYVNFEKHNLCNKILRQVNIFSFLGDAAKVLQYRCGKLPYLGSMGDDTKKIFFGLTNFPE